GLAPGRGLARLRSRFGSRLGTRLGAPSRQRLARRLPGFFGGAFRLAYGALHRSVPGPTRVAHGLSFGDVLREVPMSFILYNAPPSTCSQRVRFLLNAKGLPSDEVKLDLLAGDQLKPEYLKLNPNGVVPTLDHDGDIVIDSSVIIEYLDEVEPDTSFTPEDAVGRAKMRALMRF